MTEQPSSTGNAEDILRARAARLAKRVTSDESAAFGVEMLGFTVGREHFALESRFVFAVVQLVDLVPLPGATVPVMGLTRWRGDVLTVLDLRRVLGGVSRALDDLGRVIVTGRSSPEFGILADVIDGLTSIDPTALHRLPADRRLEIPGLLSGVTTDAVHVLDAGLLMAHQGGAPAPTTSVPPSTPVSQ